MFPQNITTTEEETQTETGTYNIISDSAKIYKTPNYDYSQMKTVLKNGDVNLVDDYQNVRNWIIKFLRTPVDIYKIYEGTGFGTSAYKLKGYKAIDGLIYAQIKSEVEQGFKLNPNILAVTGFDMYKEDKSLMIYVKVKLQDGYILEEKTEIYIIK